MLTQINLNINYKKLKLGFESLFDLINKMHIFMLIISTINSYHFFKILFLN